MIRVLKNVFLMALVILILCQVWNAKFNYFDIVFSIVIISFAILFFLDSYYSVHQQR
jgi:hypothetical protein